MQSAGQLTGFSSVSQTELPHGSSMGLAVGNLVGLLEGLAVGALVGLREG